MAERYVPKKRKYTRPGEDPDRKEDGTFRRGNKVAQKLGLYAQLGLQPYEQRICSKVRRHLEAGGVPRDLAWGLAVDYVGANRVKKAFFQLEDPVERLKLAPVFAEASQMQARIFRIRAMYSGDDPKAGAAAEELSALLEGAVTAEQAQGEEE